jgi:hypothetical protein
MRVFTTKPNKPEIINAKHQISNKSQITIIKLQKGGQLFGISNFDIEICLFFGIRNLGFHQRLGFISCSNVM